MKTLAVLVTLVLGLSCSGLGPLLVIAGGDVQLGRTLQSPLPDTKAAVNLGSLFTDKLAATPVFANLEGPVLEPNLPPENPTGKPADLVFSARTEALNLLPALGLTTVSGANNHFMDAGTAGFTSTLAGLQRLKISLTGAGLGMNQAASPVAYTVAGTKVLLLSLTLPMPGVILAGKDSAGSAGAEAKYLPSAVKQARLSDPKAFLAVSIHWGDENAPAPSQEQIDLGKQLIAAGADAVLGHHPHVLQGVLREGKGLIFFSLGNLVFDQPDPVQNQSLLVGLSRTADGRVQARLKPVVIDRTSHLPRQAEPAEAKEIFDRLEASLGPAGSPIVRNGGLAKIE